MLALRQMRIARHEEYNIEYFYRSMRPEAVDAEVGQGCFIFIAAVRYRHSANPLFDCQLGGVCQLSVHTIFWNRSNYP